MADDRGRRTAMMGWDFDAVVIGAGFFGVEIALELRRLGVRRVLLVEREGAIMRRASFVNQARVHNGYHYPRSLPTAERSQANFAAFVAEYGYAVTRGLVKIYGIAVGSRVSPAQFETFCRRVGLPCQAAPPSLSRLFDRSMVQQAYLTRELAFDSTQIAARLAPALAEQGVSVTLRTEARVLGCEAGHVAVQVGGAPLRAGHVFNCTYAGLAGVGVAIKSRIRRELAEMVLIEPPPALRGVGVTLMDGPFFSTMPFPGAGAGAGAGAGHHTLSHVRYTPHAASEDAAERLVPVRSNRVAMLRDSARYLPCLARAVVTGSLFEHKATLQRNEADDGRPILIERSATMPRVLSVLGAKIDNIFDVRSVLRAHDWTAAA